MRALTLTQPWTGLVASGVKLVENRPRKLVNPSDFGKPFAIHASREIDERVYATIERLWPPESPDPAGGRTCWYQLSRITSAVIGIATIQQVLCGWDDTKIAEHRDTLELQLGDQLRWFFGPVGYVLRDVQALPEPVPCKGALGFWTLPPAVASAVLRQIGGAP